MKKYLKEEVEDMVSDYEEQIPLKVIAAGVNDLYHNGEPVRNENSIHYVVKQYMENTEWFENLPQLYV